MKNFGQYTGWILPAALLIMLCLSGGDSWGATPQIASGLSHSIFLRSDGTLWGAGQNAFGQLGDGTLIDRSAPAAIGSSASWSAVAAGLGHNLALKADGTLWAWGDNSFGQLGVTNSFGVPIASQSAPVRVGAAGTWVAVAAAGGASSYALQADGTIWAWGDNSQGRLGNGDPTGAQINTPVQVGPPGSTFKALASGGGHVLALGSDGSLWSWGSNTNGELGLGDTVARSVPTQVLVAAALSDNDWTAISAGDAHSVALKADGTLWSWGGNSSGQLGDGSTADRATPAPVGDPALDHDWFSIAAGSQNTLALKRDGTLWGFGDNRFGQLGTGQGAPLSSTPVAAFPSNADLVAISAGAFHGSTLSSGGEIYAFGDNGDGQFGNGTKVSSSSMVLAGRDALGWLASGPGNEFTVALRSNGTLWAWGDNSNGQLGDGSILPHGLPAQVGSAGNWRALATGLSHVVALRSDGTLWSWGDNSSGQLGDNSTTASPAPIQISVTTPHSASNDWAAVAAGDLHTLALKADGSLWSWGDNSSGQLGDSTNTAQGKKPNQVVTTPGSHFDNNWVAVAAGGAHSLALQADGSLWTWGENANGQLGHPIDLANGPAPNTPNQVGLLQSWSGIAAGASHTLARQSDGTLWAWGANFNGQLGIGSTIDQALPAQVPSPGSSPFLAQAAGIGHSLALKAGGTLWSWGNNTSSQLGNGSSDPDVLNPVPHPQPAQISATLPNSSASDWAQASASGNHGVALKADGVLWSWGSNTAGQLGDGTTVDRNLPGPLFEAFTTVAASLDFGPQQVSGSPITRPLAIGNPGNADLKISALTKTGADSALFSVSLGSCGGAFPATVPAKGSCSLQVTLTPSAVAGSKSAAFTIDANDPLQPHAPVSLAAQLVQLLSITTIVNPAGAGTVSGPLQALPGSSPSYSITANAGYHLSDLKIDGVSQGAAASITLAALSAATTLQADFALNPHTVTLVQGANGVIAGPTAVLQNDTPSYTITPSANFHVVDVTVNGVSQGALTSLTLAPISADVSIAASFAVNSFAVTLVQGLHGSIVGPASALPGSSPSYSITPDLGAFITGVTVNGVPQTVTPAGMVLTLTAIGADTTLAASFGVTTFNVSVTGDAKGTVSPAGSQAIPYGTSQTFLLLPNPGYGVVKVVVDGVDQGALPASSVTFNNVTSNGHTLTVRFIPDGDLDGGGVTLGDALRALRIAVLLIPATARDLLHGDVAPADGAGVPQPDHQITIGDALGILRKVVGLPSGF
jgi:alpha-tubulin suppressor-like RCC1 family protein